MSRLKAELLIALGITGRKDITGATQDLEKMRAVAKQVAKDLGLVGGGSKMGGQFKAHFKEFADAQKVAHAQAMNNEKIRLAQERANIRIAAAEKLKTINETHRAERDAIRKTASEKARAERAERAEMSGQKRYGPIQQTYAQMNSERERAERMARRQSGMADRYGRSFDTLDAQFEIRKQMYLDRNVQARKDPRMQSVIDSRKADVGRLSEAHGVWRAALGTARSEGGDKNWNQYFGAREKMKVAEAQFLQSERMRLDIAKMLNREKQDEARTQERLARNAVKFAREEERDWKKKLRAMKQEERLQQKIQSDRSAAGRRALGWAASRGQGGIFGIHPGLIAGGIAADMGRRGLSSAFDLSREAISVSSLNAGVDYKQAQSLIRGSLRKRGGSIDELGASLRDIAGSDFQGADVGKVFNASQGLAFGSPGLGGGEATNAIITALKANNWSADKAKNVADMFVAAGPAGRVEVKDIATHYGKAAATSANLGLKLEDVLAYTSAASLGGVAAESSFTGLDQMLQSLMMANNSKTKRGAAKKLGLGTTSKWISENGLGGILGALQGYEGDNKNDLLQQVFSDKDGRRTLTSILSAGNLDRYTNAKQMIGSSKGAAARKEEEVAESDHGKLEKLKGKYLATLTDLGNAMMPLANKVIPELTKGLQSASDWLNNPRNQKSIQAWWDLAREWGPLALKLAALNMGIGVAARTLVSLGELGGAAKAAWIWMKGMQTAGSVASGAGGMLGNAAGGAMAGGAVGTGARAAWGARLATAGSAGVWGLMAAGVGAAGYYGYKAYDTYKEENTDEFKANQSELRRRYAEDKSRGRLIEDTTMPWAAPAWKRKEQKQLQQFIEASKSFRSERPRGAWESSNPSATEADQLNEWIGGASKAVTKERKEGGAKYRREYLRDKCGSVILDSQTHAPMYKNIKVKAKPKLKVDPAILKGVEPPSIEDQSAAIEAKRKEQGDALGKAFAESVKAQFGMAGADGTIAHTMALTINFQGDRATVSGQPTTTIGGRDAPTSLTIRDGMVTPDRRM